MGRQVSLIWCFCLLLVVVAISASTLDTKRSAQSPRCLKPQDRGPCQYNTIRFAYNSTSQHCEMFIYGGCGGNNNNFFDHESCIEACHPLPPQSPRCLKPQDPGPCHYYSYRFAYNSTSQQCEVFLYGGCGGNNNNFFKHKSCTEACHPLPRSAPPTIFTLTCVDNTGLARREGDMWHPDQCHECQCLNKGKVECQELPVTCPPQPHPSCIEVPAPCCPTWNCTTNRPDCSNVTCLTEPLGEDCEKIDDDPLSGCPCWMCSGCNDTFGNYHSLNSTWQPTQCITSMCTPEGVVNKTTECPSQPHRSCHSHYTQEECCPEWKCSGCVDLDGQFHEVNSVWTSSGCTLSKCTPEGILTKPFPCPDTPCTPEGIHTEPSPCHDFPLTRCVEVAPKEGECCPTWYCGLQLIGWPPRPL